MLFAEFKERIESAYAEKFNHSFVKCSVFKCLGKSITIEMTLAENSAECISGIAGNDMIRCSFMIHLPDGWTETENLPEQMEMEALQKCIKIKPESDYLYCSHKTISYRKAKGNAEKLIVAFGKFVDKLAEAVEAEYKADNLLAYDSELIRQKGYFTA